MAEWARVVASNAPKYIPGYVDASKRERILLTRLQSSGGVKANASGRSFEWRAYAQENATGNDGIGSTTTYTANQPYKIATLEYQAGYKQPDAMHIKERLLNQGAEAIIRHYDEITKQNSLALMRTINKDLYADGNASGNSQKLAGLETFFGQGTCASGDVICQPTDTYAGLATDVAQLSSVWDNTLSTQPNATIATDWPDGAGESGYDYWSPKIGNYKSTTWGTSLTTWKGNAETSLRKIAAWIQSTSEELPGDVVMTAAMLADFRDYFASRSRLLVEVPENTDLGIPTSVQFDGMKLYADFNCPAGIAYLLNYNHMSLMHLGGQLPMVEPPAWSPQMMSWLYLIYCYGNMKFDSPKYFGKMKSIA